MYKIVNICPKIDPKIGSSMHKEMKSILGIELLKKRVCYDRNL